MFCKLNNTVDLIPDSIRLLLCKLGEPLSIKNIGRSLQLTDIAVDLYLNFYIWDAINQFCFDFCFCADDLQRDILPVLIFTTIMPDFTSPVTQLSPRASFPVI